MITFQTINNQIHVFRYGLRIFKFDKTSFRAWTAKALNNGDILFYEKNRLKLYRSGEIVAVEEDGGPIHTIVALYAMADSRHFIVHRYSGYDMNAYLMRVECDKIVTLRNLGPVSFHVPIDESVVEDYPEFTIIKDVEYVEDVNEILPRDEQ